MSDEVIEILENISNAAVAKNWSLLKAIAEDIETNNSLRLKEKLCLLKIMKAFAST